MIEVGKFVNTFGIKGEIKVYPYVSYFEDLKSFNLNNKKMEIEKIRFKKNVYIVKIKGIDDINEIENLKGSTLTIEEDEKPKHSNGEYYIEDIIGFDVFDDKGNKLGKLDDVFNTGANDIYEVGDILLPAIDDVIKEVDLENKKIIVHLIKGLI